MPVNPEPLTRIGAPPQKPKRKPRLVLVAVLAALVGIVIIGAAVLFPRALQLVAKDDSAGSSTPSPARTLSVETQVECADVKHAYANWYTEHRRLQTLHEQSRLGAGLDLMRLLEDGKTFLAAAENRPDKPAKQLAVDVATYNVELSLVNIGLAGNGKVDSEHQQNALAAWRKVESSYTAFLALTCSV